MDLKRLKYFCTVVEHGNITQAARALNMAQPPLSKRLQELEDEVGVPLFLRGSRKIEVTPAGYFLYKKAGEILRSVEEAARETVLLAKSETRTLKIGLTHLFQSYFKSLVIEIHRQNRNIEIGVTVSDSSHLELLLNNGLIDIALIQKPDHLEAYDCIAFPAVKMVAVINKALWDEEGDVTMSLADVGRFPLVLLKRGSGSGTFEFIQDRFRKCGVQANIVMHISQPGVILDWLDSGLEAASLLPASEVKSQSLANCRVVDVSPSLQVFYPSVVKLSSSLHMKEVMDVVGKGYPFPGA